MALPEINDSEINDSLLDECLIYSMLASKDCNELIVCLRFVSVFATIAAPYLQVLKNLPLLRHFTGEEKDTPTKGTHISRDHPQGTRTAQAMAETDLPLGREGPTGVPTGLTGSLWNEGTPGIDMIGRGSMAIPGGEVTLGLKVHVYNAVL